MKQVCFLSLVFLLCFSQAVSAQKKDTKNNVTSKEENEEDEKEDIETASLHSRQLWFKLMHQPHVNYFTVKKAYDDYFKNHPAESSAPREYGLSWFKTKLF